MATIASQVIFHPAVSHSLKYGGTTLGRDKAYRALQYFARFYAWYLLTKGNKEEASRWANLKTHLGTARKLMRLGKPIEHLQAALKASLVSGPLAEIITTVARQIGYFGYLSSDALVWANSIKFIKLDSQTAQRLAKRSFQLWFTGIIFSIINSVLKASRTVRLNREERSLQASATWGEKDLGEEAARETKLSAIAAARATTRQQFIIDLCDVWIPATGSGLLNVNEGALGILGLISSLLGVKAQWLAVNGKK
ncbi:peroxisomal biogenesis factor 11 [Macrolepiota fuliginosa MF-IS2]|uniref:Peroxisomal biogenesis factor 11 n=1 Tax=Macrolepiota fuliginosa MF-IS2 TaxID=1400762 RepID=A0A9P6C877_9AGAR|nr:peroxisomal biogenesis factor 11 [Macrolepiota fuliginosa MF-IS2]